MEKAVVFSQEFYLGIVNDRSLAKPVLILSSSGGVEIEVVARTKPEKIEKAPINPARIAKLHRARAGIQAGRGLRSLESASTNFRRPLEFV